MSRSIVKRLQTGALTRLLLVVAMVFTVTVLSGCGGGLFGTSDGDANADANAAAAPDPGMIEGTVPEPADNSPDASPGVDADSPPLPVTENPPPGINFSNTTPSGIDADSSELPALKLINLTQLSVTVSTVDQSVSVSPQNTSDLLGVTVGESLVDINIQDSERSLVSIAPLNAAADSLTTLVIEANEMNDTASDSTLSVSLLALDTRAVASADAMADVRIVLTPSAAASATQPRFTLLPVEGDSSGSELVLSNANEDDPAVGVYTLANAGTYLLSSSDSSFTPEPVTLQADTVYTIIITGNPQTPVYVEVDSLTETP